MDSTVALTAEVSEHLTLLLREKRYGPFVRLLNQSLQQCGPSAELCRYAAEYSRATGKLPELRRFLVQWAAHAPNDPAPRWQLADLFASLGEAGKAVEALDLAEMAGADPLQVVIRKTQVLLMGGQYVLAAEAAARGLAEHQVVVPVSHLLTGFATLGQNLAAAQTRPDLKEMVQSVAKQAAGLQADPAGILLDNQGTVKRLSVSSRSPELIDKVTGEIRNLVCGCVIGSADLMDLAQHAAKVHDGSFWGSRSRVYVLETDEDLLTLGLATFDMRNVLADEVVTWIWGPTAIAQLDRRLTECEDEPPYNITVSSNPLVSPVVDKVYLGFRQKMANWFRESSAYYAGLPREHWADILGDSPSRPPRVLLITTEFSSFMRFAIRDVAQALSRAGWQVHVAKESLPSQRLSGAQVPRLVAELHPDLIWQINYARHTWQGAIPDGVPFLCWDQDAMPHLASSEVASKMTRFDFLATAGSGVGYIRRYGYPAAQLLHLPMCVDRTLFHPDPSQEAATRASYVSHHGWTLENRVAKILENLVPRVAEVLRPILLQYAVQLDNQLARDGYPLRKDHCGQALLEILQQYGVHLPDDYLEYLQDYTYRILPNIFWRHQTLRMAIGAGLEPALYGFGWDQNEEFSRFAKGVVEHGQPLAHVFRSCRFAIQSVLAGNEHQRLWEAAACGAVVLMRYHPGDELYRTLREWMDRFEKGLGRCVEDVIPQDQRVHPVGRYVYEFIRIGLAGQDGVLDESVLSCLRHAAQFPSVRDKLGDVFEDLVFRSKEDLRAKLGRILHDESHYNHLRQRLLEAAHNHKYEMQLPRVIRQIRQRLLT